MGQRSRLIESEGGRYLCGRPAEEPCDEALESHQVISSGSSAAAATEAELAAAAAERLGQRREDKPDGESCLFWAFAPDYYHHQPQQHHHHHLCLEHHNHHHQHHQRNRHYRHYKERTRAGEEAKEKRPRGGGSMERPGGVALRLALLLLATSSMGGNHDANCDRFLFVGAQDVAPHQHQQQHQQQPQQPRPRQSFRRKLEPQYERTAGESVVLGCEVAEQAGEAFWLYRRSPTASSYHLFARNGHRAEGARERYVLLADPNSGNHTLELRQLQPDDSGEYECQITPAPDDPDGVELRTSTRLVVSEPAPPPPAPLQELEPAQPHLLVSGSRLEQASAFQPAQLHRNPATSFVILAGSPSATRSAHSTAQPAAAAASSSALGGLLLAWPNLLLLLAALLMLANVYLIYSLAQRHRRRQRRGKQQTSSDGSVESAATSSSSVAGGDGASNTGSGPPVARAGSAELEGLSWSANQPGASVSVSVLEAQGAQAPGGCGLENNFHQAHYWHYHQSQQHQQQPPLFLPRPPSSCGLPCGQLRELHC